MKSSLEAAHKLLEIAEFELESAKQDLERLAMTEAIVHKINLPGSENIAGEPELVGRKLIHQEIQITKQNLKAAEMVTEVMRKRTGELQKRLLGMCIENQSAVEKIRTFNNDTGLLADLHALNINEGGE